MQAILKEYAGKYSDPRLDDFYRNFPKYMKSAEKTIQKKLGLSPPPDTVTIGFELDDELTGPPMVRPTGFSTKNGKNGNLIRLSTISVTNDFWGLTTSQKVVIHELVHAYCMYYGGQPYEEQPLWLKEGLALWTADQDYPRDFSKVPITLRNKRWLRYLSYITRFENELQKHSPKDIVRYMLGNK